MRVYNSGNNNNHNQITLFMLLIMSMVNLLLIKLNHLIGITYYCLYHMHIHTYYVDRYRDTLSIYI